MAKRIIFIHGRNFKPHKHQLKRCWDMALAAGIERDFGKRGLNKLNNRKRVRKSMAYYGDLSNAFLRRAKKTTWNQKQISKNYQDRLATIRQLKEYAGNEFTKSRYKQIDEPGDKFFTMMANVFSGPVSLTGLGDELVGTVAPDMVHYWNPDTAFGSDVRWRVTTELTSALKSGDDVMVIAHSLGSIAAFDVLWKLSHYGEYQEFRDKKIHTLVTLGSPLGDEIVKQNLKGAAASNKRRYPGNIGRWINIAAHDDYICHDTTVANDFKRMQSLKLCHIRDIPVYNMAITPEGANPHSSAGYLIHPRLSKIVHDFL